MAVAGPVLVVLAVGLPVVLALALAGRLVLRRLGCLRADDTSGFATASGFFVGQSLLLVAVLPGSLGHARALYLGATAALAAAAVAELRHLGRIGCLRAVGRCLGVATALALALFAGTLALTLWPLTRGPQLVTWDHFGSFHSGRYVNIALWIASHDRIPRLQQNFGQSMLVALHLVLGARAPFVSLTEWLAANAAWVVVLVAGLLRRLLRAPRWLVPGTLIVVAGNTAASLEHVLVFDNGSPILMMGYADVLAGVGSFLVFVAWLLGELDGDEPPSERSLAVPALLAAGWAISAPQNVVGAALASVAVAGFGLLARASLARALFGLVVVALGAATTAPFGGMFMPAHLVEDTGLPFIMEAGGNGRGLEWSPHMPGYYGFRAPPYDGHDPGPVYDPLDDSPLDARWFVARVRAAVVMFAFPLLGTLGMLVWRPRWGATAAACLVPAWLLVFGFSLNGYKWELTRFLVPGTTLGMIGLVVAADAVTARRSRQSQLAAIALLSAATLVGPAREVFVSVRADVVTSWSSFGTRLATWSTTHELLPK